MTRPGAEEPRPDILDSQPGWWTTVPLPRLPRLPQVPRPPRWLLLVAVAALLAGGGTLLATSAGGHGPQNRPVIGPDVPFIPTACGHFTSAQAPSGNRIVLGDVAVPPAYVGPMMQNGNGPWRYFRSAVFGVKGGSPPVTLSVPGGQQREAAIDLEVDGLGHIFHIPGCPPSHTWHATVGGFYLKTPTACLPLQVQVGQQSTLVTFGLGRHCPAPAPLFPGPLIVTHTATVQARVPLNR
jgi:hypothetical protein